MVLCTFNGARYLGEQLESLKTQDRPADEIVISDDHSTDSTWDVLQRFREESDIPVVLHRPASHVGFVENFNEAIGLATGEIVFLCDQDDVWLPKKIGDYERVFLDHPEVGMVFGDALLIDSEGRSLYQTAWQREVVDFTAAQRRSWVSIPGAAVERLIWRNVVTGSTMAFRSRYRGVILPMPDWELHGMPHDTWAALLIAAVAPTLPLSKIHTHYRLHQGQVLGLNAPEAVDGSQHAEVLSTIRSRLVLVAERLESVQDGFPPLDESLSTIWGKVDHLGARLELQGSILRRIGPVWREVRRGRYVRYSTGYISAVLDLIPWARQWPVGPLRPSR